MPNLVPPVTTVSQALEYKKRLQALDSTVNYLMTLYLHPSITPEVVREAKKAGIAGIKSYPQGLTTNSESGVTSYEEFYPVFAVMEEVGMVLVSCLSLSRRGGPSQTHTPYGTLSFCTTPLPAVYKTVFLFSSSSFSSLEAFHLSLGDDDVVEI